MDTLERIQQLLKAQGWTKYRLAKESGLAQSTIINIFNHNTVPSIITLEAICKAFNITIAQFFATDDMIELSDNLREFINEWKLLTADQKEALSEYLTIMKYNKERWLFIFLHLKCHN